MLHSSPEYYYTISRVNVFFSLHVFHDTRLRIGKLLWILFKHCHVCLMWALILRKWNIRENYFCLDFVLLKHQGHQTNTLLFYAKFSVVYYFFKKWCLRVKFTGSMSNQMHSISDFLISISFCLPKLVANAYSSFYLKLLWSFIYSIIYFLRFFWIHIIDSKNRQTIIINWKYFLLKFFWRRQDNFKCRREHSSDGNLQ